MSSDDVLSLQQKLMASWVGCPLDKEGIVRLLNPGGTRPPLLWVFNTAQEPERLIKTLGHDQPLIFSRSSHLLVQPNTDPTETRRVLATHLLREVAQHFPRTQFDVGTSCQGCGVVMHFCSKLAEFNIDVGSLCLINCSLPQELANRPALLVYGDRDKGQDPFEKDFTDANRRAETVFSIFQRRTVPARHGQYYAEHILPGILDQFAAFRSSASHM